MAADPKETERRVSARSRAERLLARVFDASPDYIAISRAVSGELVAVNAEFERVTGYRAGEVLGRTAVELGLWEEPQERARLVADLRAGTEVRNRPVRMRVRDGRGMSGAMSAFMVEQDGEQFVIGIVRDMSETERLERRAAQSERMFGALFESSPEPITLYRIADGIRLAANEAWERASGYRREAAVGRHIDETILWKDDAQALDAVARLEAHGRVSNIEAHLTRADGSTFEALISGVRIHLEGEPCVLWTWRDLSDYRRLEQRARASEHKFASLFETSPVALVVSRASDSHGARDRIVEINDAALALIGVPREQALGAAAGELVRWVDAAGVEALRQRALAGERIVGGLVEFDRRDGRRVEALLSGVRLEVAGEPHFVISLLDVSERKRQEAVLMNIARGVSAEVGEAFFESLVMQLARELEADFAFVAELVQQDGTRFRTLAAVADGRIAPSFEYAVEGSPCATALDGRGTVIYPSGVAELFPRDIGLRRERVEGYVGTSVHAADGRVIGILVVMHRKPIERGPYWGSIIEIFGARAGAEIERARAEMLVRRTNASLERAVRERTGELEEANRDLESFNYSISHDLRQPLNAIAGFAELLREAGGAVPAADRRQFLKEIEDNAARMDRMIIALLQLARAGRGPLVESQVDMRALVDEVLGALEAGASPGAQVEIGALPSARGDAVLLRQVWGNLIGNALKYSRGRKRPQVRVWAEAREAATEYAVSDNGVGFDMAHVERLFEPFHRLPSAAEFEGNGVGLAIVQRILRRHGGRVVAESAPGRGATFRFTLPA